MCVRGGWIGRVEDANGLEGWRLLQAEYEPKQAARWAQMLQGILAPKWTSSATFEVDIREWEIQLRRYEDAASVRVPDPIKCAAIVPVSYTQLRAH